MYEPTEVALDRLLAAIRERLPDGVDVDDLDGFVVRNRPALVELMSTKSPKILSFPADRVRKSSESNADRMADDAASSPEVAGKPGLLTAAYREIGEQPQVACASIPTLPAAPRGHVGLRRYADPDAIAVDTFPASAASEVALVERPVYHHEYDGPTTQIGTEWVLYGPKSLAWTSDLPQVRYARFGGAELNALLKYVLTELAAGPPWNATTRTGLRDKRVTWSVRASRGSSFTYVTAKGDVATAREVASSIGLTGWFNSGEMSTSDIHGKWRVPHDLIRIADGQMGVPGTKKDPLRAPTPAASFDRSALPKDAALTWTSPKYGNVLVTPGAQGRRDVWHNVTALGVRYGWNGSRWAQHKPVPTDLLDEVVAHGWGRLFGRGDAQLPPPKPRPDVGLEDATDRRFVVAVLESEGDKLGRLVVVPTESEAKAREAGFQSWVARTGVEQLGPNVTVDSVAQFIAKLWSVDAIRIEGDGPLRVVRAAGAPAEVADVPKPTPVEPAAPRPDRYAPIPFQHDKPATVFMAGALGYSRYETRRLDIRLVRTTRGGMALSVNWVEVGIRKEQGRVLDLTTALSVIVLDGVGHDVELHKPNPDGSIVLKMFDKAQDRHAREQIEAFIAAHGVRVLADYADLEPETA